MNNKCSRPVAGDLVIIAGHYGESHGPKHVIRDELWVGINPESIFGACEYSEQVFSTGSIDKNERTFTLMFNHGAEVTNFAP